ncbi:MAG: element excision factor XisH family protein, partial [Prochlorothrix sp.]
MAAKDRFHEQVRTALIQEGWTITHRGIALILYPMYLTTSRL